MPIKFFCPRWGSKDLSWSDFVHKAKDAGYDGIEYGIANDAPLAELDEAWESAERLNMPIIPQHHATNDRDINHHANNYAGWFEKIRPYPAIKVNTQTGKDFFTFEQNKLLIDIASRYSKDNNVEVLHETHRGKFSFAAHVTYEYLQKISDLRLVLDISHWVNVATSYLEDQPEAVGLALERTGHIHARVGYTEGPQIPDPRVPEWSNALNIHLQWWDRVAERMRKESPDAVITITPEFGPYPYMVHLPGKNEPITNQWDVNVFMMELLRERYSA